MRQEVIKSINGLQVVTESGAKVPIGNMDFFVGQTVWTEDGYVFGHSNRKQLPQLESLANEPNAKRYAIAFGNENGESESEYVDAHIVDVESEEIIHVVKHVALNENLIAIDYNDSATAFSAVYNHQNSFDVYPYGLISDEPYQIGKTRDTEFMYRICYEADKLKMLICSSNDSESSIKTYMNNIAIQTMDITSIAQEFARKHAEEYVINGSLGGIIQSYPNIREDLTAIGEAHLGDYAPEHNPRISLGYFLTPPPEFNVSINEKNDIQIGNTNQVIDELDVLFSSKLTKSKESVSVPDSGKFSIEDVYTYPVSLSVQANDWLILSSLKNIHDYCLIKGLDSISRSPSPSNLNPSGKPAVLIESIMVVIHTDYGNSEPLANYVNVHYRDCSFSSNAKNKFYEQHIYSHSIHLRGGMDMERDYVCLEEGKVIPSTMRIVLPDKSTTLIVGDNTFYASDNNDMPDACSVSQKKFLALKGRGLYFVDADNNNVNWHRNILPNAHRSTKIHYTQFNSSARIVTLTEEQLAHTIKILEKMGGSK